MGKQKRSPLMIPIDNIHFFILQHTAKFMIFQHKDSVLVKQQNSKDFINRLALHYFCDNFVTVDLLKRKQNQLHI